MFFSALINFFKKNKKIILLCLLALVEALDLFTLSRFLNNKFPSYSESLMNRFQFDSLQFRPAVYGDILHFNTCVLAFVFGGVLAFIVVKITGKIALGTGLINYEILSLVPMALFIIIFLLGSIFSGWKLTWFCPLLAYIGGLFFYFMSQIKFKVNYYN